MYTGALKLTPNSLLFGSKQTSTKHIIVLLISFQEYNVITKSNALLTFCFVFIKVHMIFY